MRKILGIVSLVAVVVAVVAIIFDSSIFQPTSITEIPSASTPSGESSETETLPGSTPSGESSEWMMFLEEWWWYVWEWALDHRVAIVLLISGLFVVTGMFWWSTRAGLTTLGLIGLGFVIFHMEDLGWWAESIFSPHGPRPRFVERTAPNCPGVLEVVTLTSDRWELINPGFKCAVNLRTLQGVALIGEPARYTKDRPGIDLGNILEKYGIRVIYARAWENTAQFEYILCPHGRIHPDEFRCT